MRVSTARVALLTLCASTYNCSSDSKNPDATDASITDAHVLDGSLTDASASDAAVDAGEVTLKGPPPEVLKAAKEWPLANRDYEGTRATFDSSINKASVSKLDKAWAFDLPGGGTFGAATAPALVLDGVVYYIDMSSNVFAIDLATGQERWSKLYDAPTGGPNGVAVGYGKVFVNASDKTVTALDIATGDELWTADIEIPKTGGISITPLVYGGFVYVSTVPVNSNSSYLGGVNGTLYAIEQATGKVAWKFATVEDETLWGNADINSGGGAWYPPTIDVSRDVMYWGIGNPAPYPGVAEFPNGTSHPGDNLYTNSVLALGSTDGSYKWHYQDKPHDFMDHDFQNPPVIVTTTVDGTERHLVIGSGKTGTVAAVDAEDGSRVWRTLVGKHENDDLKEIPTAGVVVFPGDLGGVETPVAYAEGTVFVAVCNQGRQLFPDHSGDLDATGTGELVALAVDTGKQKWKKDFAAQLYGSVNVVNDLVITSTFDGKIFALDRETGDQVWTYKVSGVNAPLTVSGDTLIIPAGGGLGTPTIVALKIP